MPIYEYQCKQHGTFEEVRSISEYRTPAPCPTCDVESARIMSVPRLALVDPSTRVAMDRNAKSRCEPQVRTHGAHCHGEHAAPRKAQAKGRQGLKAYTGPRPWVMEHA